MKWADFAVTRVQYAKDGNGITAYEVRVDLGDVLGPPTMVPWKTMVEAILKGVTFVTAVQGSDGKFHRGADLDIVVKTVEDAAKGDNLDHLPSVA